MEEAYIEQEFMLRTANERLEELEANQAILESHVDDATADMAEKDTEIAKLNHKLSELTRNRKHSLFKSLNSEVVQDVCYEYESNH